MKISYWLSGEDKPHSMIDPEYKSPKESWKSIKLIFPNLWKIEIEGIEYRFSDGLEQVELHKRLYNGR